jgi:exosortase E/protease (VPEID-CTERM system)
MPGGLRARGDPAARVAAAESESGWRMQRWFVAALLPAEILLLSLPQLESAAGSLGFWARFVLDHQRGLLAAVALGVVATVVLSWPAFCSELRSEAAAPRIYRKERSNWLLTHLLAVAGIVAWVGFRARVETASAALAYLWLLGGGALIVIASACWCLAFASEGFWWRWFRRSKGAFALGAAIAIFGRSSGHFLQGLPSLKTETLYASAFVLKLIGQNVQVDPTYSTISTGSLTVYVSDYCSGIEGIALILVFTIGYLWFFRHDLRFPHAFILLPIGSAVVWLLNALRIDALVLIGMWSGAFALQGFHSLAGWLLFIATGLGMVAAARRTPLWIAQRSAAPAAHAPNAAEPYLMPFLVVIAARMLTSAFFSGFNYGYPLQVILAAIVLWYYVPRLKSLEWKMSGGAVGMGAAAALIWVFLDDRGSGAATANQAFRSGLNSMSLTTASIWLLIRISGALIVAPLVEELAFRGYLLRKLIATDFEGVEFNRFTWISFTVSSIAFGLLHQSWLAGIVAGMIFALAMYRRGRLADAIGAHAVANGLVIAYAIVTGHWSTLG